MPTSVSDSGKGAPETSGVATAPVQVNLGPFSISGRIVLLLDDAASGQQQVLQQQPTQEPPLRQQLAQETSPQRASAQEPSPGVPSPQGPVGAVFTPETPEAAPGTARIDELLALLSSPDFSEREAAEAELTRLARAPPVLNKRSISPSMVPATRKRAPASRGFCKHSVTTKRNSMPSRRELFLET